MKRFALLLCLLGTATTAHALEVTNLDTIPHRVLFEGAGTKQTYDVPVNQTVRIAGQPNGTVSLLSAQHPKPSKGVLHDDSGLLSGILGNGRTEGIPVESNDALVIWQGGSINIQQRRRGGRYGN